MIALAAGIAGAYVQMRKEEASLLPGVATGVSLVPPLAAIVLSASAVFFFLAMRSALREKGQITSFGFGAIATLVVVGILAIQLDAATLQRFDESRKEELIVAQVNAWARDNPIGLRHLDADFEGEKRMVDVGLIVDVPRSRADPVIAPSKTFPPDSTRKELLNLLAPVVGPGATVTSRIEVQYSGQWDIETQEYIGMPEAFTEADQ